MLLRILHLSDLHERGPRDPERWRRDDEVLGNAWRQNLRVIREEGPVHLVCFTGDIAFSGKREEYARATAFIEELTLLLQVGKDAVFLVPGNHDVDRDCSHAEYAAVRAAVDHNVDPLQMSRWLANTGCPPHGVDPAWRDPILARQAEFYRWLADDLKLGDLVPRCSPHGALGFSALREISGVGLIEVVGLNTAWLSGEHDASNLLVTDDQLGRLAPRGDDSDHRPIRIALMHHSIPDLLDGRDVQRKLADRFDLVLRGHLHRTESAHYLLDGDRGFAEFAVSSLFDSDLADKYHNGCQVITLNADSRPLAGTVRFRSWSTAGFWFDDNSLYSGTRDGRLNWALRGSMNALLDLRTFVARPAPSSDRCLADYLRSLRRNVSPERTSKLFRPDRVYVSQPALRLREASRTSVSLLEAMGEFWSSDRRRIMVLGNYGMGKTYFALRTVIAQVDAFHDPKVGRIPLYFSLRDLNYGAAVSDNPLLRCDLVDQILANAISLDFPQMARWDFVQLLANGILAVVLDGLDELNIPREVSWKTLLQPLLEIDGAFCMVTSRTAYVEDKETLLREWDIYEMQDWGEAEWIEYVNCCRDELADVGGPDEFVRSVKARSGLQRLTSRPLWCFMIVAVRQRIREMADLDIAELYQFFLDETVEPVMRRSITSQILTIEQKYRALERFAETSAFESRTSVSQAEFRETLSAMFLELGLGTLDAFLCREIRVYSFLNCDHHNRLSFGHASFAAYFVAAALARVVVSQCCSTTHVGSRVGLGRGFIARRELNEDQLVFLAGILGSVDVLTSLRILGGSTSYDEVLAGVEPLVRDELASRRASTQLRRNLFLTLLLILRRRGVGKPVLRGLCLRGVLLAGSDMSDCIFRDVDFGGSILNRANFHRSTLMGCTFARATLDEADFEGADLSGADFRFIEVPLSPPRFEGAMNVRSARFDSRVSKHLGEWLAADTTRDG